MNGLRFRLIDLETGEIILEQTVEHEPEAAGEYAAELGNELIAQGRSIRLEVQDPDGVILPAGEWITVGGGRLASEATDE
jgi:hypothetical protein